MKVMFGWKQKDGIKRKDEKEAAIIKAVFEKCTISHSYQSIANTLHISKSMVQHILSRKSYAKEGFVSAKLFKQAKQAVKAKKAPPEKKLAAVEENWEPYDDFCGLFPTICKNSGIDLSRWKKEVTSKGKRFYTDWDNIRSIELIGAMYTLLKNQKENFFTMSELRSIAKQGQPSIKKSLERLEKLGLAEIDKSEKNRVVGIRATKELLTIIESTKTYYNEIFKESIKKVITQRLKYHAPPDGKKAVLNRLKEYTKLEM